VSNEKAEKCPGCGRTGVMVVYGMPGPDLLDAAERGGVSIGGCVITGNDPDQQCQSCGQMWKTDDSVALGPQ
jgi:hypothetical protein